MRGSQPLHGPSWCVHAQLAGASVEVRLTQPGGPGWIYVDVPSFALGRASPELSKEPQD